MSDFKAKMHPIRFRLGLRPRPRWGSLQRSPRPRSWIWGALLLRKGKGRGGEGRGREGRRGKGRKEGGGEGVGTPFNVLPPGARLSCATESTQVRVGLVSHSSGAYVILYVAS